jgi:hypothetical protein
MFGFFYKSLHNFIYFNIPNRKFVTLSHSTVDYNLFNLHVTMYDNDNVVTDEVKLINK